MALIIAGHQRSGTTLLKDLFNSHPDAWITGEFGNFMLLGTSYGQYRRFILKRWWQKRNAAILESHNLRGVNMLNNLSFVLRYLQKIRSHTNHQVQAATIEMALKDLAPGKVVVGDKYPDQVFRLQDIQGIDELRVLFICRDPRDVASSALKRARVELRNSWPDELRNPAKIAKRWIWTIRQTERFPDKVLVVRYEDLVTDPKPFLADLSQWLGLDPQGFQSAMIHRTSIGKHRSGLSDEEVDQIIQVAGSTMQRLGYLAS